jgi:hypothetical protein
VLIGLVSLSLLLKTTLNRMSSFLPTRIFLMYQIIEGEVDCIDKCHHLGSVPIKCKVMVVLTQHFLHFVFAQINKKVTRNLPIQN